MYVHSAAAKFDRGNCIGHFSGRKSKLQLIGKQTICSLFTRLYLDEQTSSDSFLYAIQPGETCFKYNGSKPPVTPELLALELQEQWGRSGILPQAEIKVKLNAVDLTYAKGAWRHRSCRGMRMIVHLPFLISSSLFAHGSGFTLAMAVTLFGTSLLALIGLYVLLSFSFELLYPGAGEPFLLSLVILFL